MVSVCVCYLRGLLGTAIGRGSYPEGVRGAEVELLPDGFGGSGTQPVEDVVVPLLFALPADPGLLQQVVRHKATHHGVLKAPHDC